MQQKRWPGVSATDEDRRIIASITKQDGILRSIDMKDLLMLAASIALKKNAPMRISTGNESRTNQIIHPTLLNSHPYREYRQYIALIFYFTDGGKKLDNMSDTSMMVKTFVDYAQRGLHILKIDYLEDKDSSEKMVTELLELLHSHK
jgi:hypothetical protein